MRFRHIRAAKVSPAPRSSAERSPAGRETTRKPEACRAVVLFAESVSAALAALAAGTSGTRRTGGAIR
ncbi:MAG TPA: hypothetical protein DCX83_09800, partial [Pseudomonas sp.]|nr:hypothetical protein [Pseudomonas sp.]